MSTRTRGRGALAAWAAGTGALSLRAVRLSLHLFPVLMAWEASAGETTGTRPVTYQEAPMLAARVARGELPPVQERLPENPAVVEPIERIGTYGGSWRLMATAVSDLQLNNRHGYEPLLRWDRSGKKAVPGIAESWEMKDDGRTFIFHLRKGMKWSDGHPFTSDAFMFTYEDILQHPKIILPALSWLKSNNKHPRIEAPDPYTVVFRFEKPYGAFPLGLAFQGVQHELFGPRHYLKQFHDRYAPVEKLNAQAKEAGFPHWADYFLLNRMDLDKNPDLPTIAPFQVRVSWPAERCIAQRNPYYWKVDPEGRQLPYIDELTYTAVFDNTMLNLKSMNGEVDFQMRRIDSANYTLFKERSRERNYRVLTTPSTNPICIYLNQCSRDDKLRPILQDRRFRLALSYAINRKELIELVYSGTAEPSNAVITQEDPFYEPGLESKNIEYNPAEANRLLDAVGLLRGEDGMRRFPDGSPFFQLLRVYPSEEGASADLWQLVVDYWREVGLQFTAKHEDLSLSFIQVTAGNSDFWCYVNAGLHWSIEGLWKVPMSNLSYYAPLYGKYNHSNGRGGVKPPPEHQRLLEWYAELRSTPDEQRRLLLGRKILRQWADECYVIGICRPPIVAVVSNRFRNVPDKISYDYRLKSPGFIGIEQFFLEGALQP